MNKSTFPVKAFEREAARARRLLKAAEEFDPFDVHCVFTEPLPLGHTARLLAPTCAVRAFTSLNEGLAREACAILAADGGIWLGQRVVGGRPCSYHNIIGLAHWCAMPPMDDGRYFRPGGCSRTMEAAALLALLSGFPAQLRGPVWDNARASLALAALAAADRLIVYMRAELMRYE